MVRVRDIVRGEGEVVSGKSAAGLATRRHYYSRKAFPTFIL